MSEIKVPAAVVRAFADGIELKKRGLHGQGLMPATYDEAVQIVRTGKMDSEKFSRMRAWLARHGASPVESEALARQIADWKRGRLTKKSPALVAWLLWGGDAAVSWIQQSEPGFLSKKNPSTQMKMLLSGSAPRTIKGKFSLIKCENGSTAECDLISHGPNRDIAIELLQNPEFDHRPGDMCIVTNSTGSPDLIAVSNGSVFLIVSNGCIGGSLVARWEGPQARADDMLHIAIYCGVNQKIINQCCCDIAVNAMRKNVAGKRIDHPMILKAASICSAYAENPSSAYRVPLSEAAQKLRKSRTAFAGEEQISCDLVLAICSAMTKPRQGAETLIVQEIPVMAAKLKNWYSDSRSTEDGLLALAVPVRDRITLSSLIASGIRNGRLRTVG